MAMNFEERYFDQLQEGFNELKKEVRDNTALTNKVLDQAKKTNGRVTKAEADINKLNNSVFPKRPKSSRDLPPIWQNKQLIMLATFVFGFLFVTAILVATFKGIKIPGING